MNVRRMGISLPLFTTLNTSTVAPDEKRIHTKHRQTHMRNLSQRRLRYITLQYSEHVLALFHLARSLFSSFIRSHECELSNPDIQAYFMNEFWSVKNDVSSKMKKDSVGCLSSLYVPRRLKLVSQWEKNTILTLWMAVCQYKMSIYR